MLRSLRSLPSAHQILLSTTHLLPDPLDDDVQLIRQGVYLQGQLELLLVPEQVAMETRPPGKG